MKVRALYCRENYNAFSEHSDPEFYGIDVEVPDDTDIDFLKDEAIKKSALSLGHRFHSLEILSVDDEKKLLKYYMDGWHDELNGTTSSFEGYLNIKAYKLGAIHAICGDEGGQVGLSFDLKSESEILNEILKV